MDKTKNNMMLKPLEMYALVASGKLRKFPNNYLDKSSIKEMLRYVILESYHYTREEVLVKVNKSFLQANYLGGAYKFFNKSNIEMLIACFPEWNLKPWEFREVKNGFWNDVKNQREFLFWVAEKEGIDLTTKSGLRSMTARIIQMHGGSKAIIHAGGTFELLDIVACGKYKKWEIAKMSSWSKAEIIEATKWLVEERLNYTPRQVCNLKVTDFIENNLDGMLQKACNHSIIAALEMAYPGMYYKDATNGICLIE